MTTPRVTHGRTSTTRAAQTISNGGAVILRLGLVIPLAWIGIAKFTSTEAAGIKPLIVPLLTESGGFLIKDIALLGAAMWTLGEALLAHTSKGAVNVAEDG